MTAYYNEIDPFAAQWLRNLIAAGHIAPGIVDTRSIEDVSPSELRGFTQCHFFAGIGVWSHALRNAGWPDDREIWTGSCPCQPFSSAGQGAGFADERHLWPAFHHLIKECRPAAVLGEQVASKNAEPWIDLVCDDLEALGYAFGAIPFPASCVGAPHIRDRLYWVADASGERREWRQRPAHRRVGHGGDAGRIESHDGIARPGEAGLRLADTERYGGGSQAAPADYIGTETDRPADWAGGRGGSLGGLADAASARLEEQVLLSRHGAIELQEGVLPERWAIQDTRSTGMPSPTNGFWRDGLGGMADANGYGSLDGVERANEQRAEATAQHCGNSRWPSPTNGLWRDADWLLCRDGKWRPVEPGTSPLAHGVAQRVGRLRAYGNAIVAPAAQAFIESVM